MTTEIGNQFDPGKYSGSGFLKIEQPHEPILAVIDDTIALEALDDFLVVQEDKFRTGYECKSCDGLGHTTEPCTKCKGSKTQIITDLCPSCNGVGRVNDLFREVGEPQDIVKTKQCRDCRGSGKIDLGNIERGLNLCNACIVMHEANTSGGFAAPCGFTPCAVCKGRGVALVVPQESLRRPNSGIVKSTGPKVTNIKCGDRVMYSNHTGYEIYFKRNLKFRQMREHEIMSRIHGVGEIHKVLE